MDPFLSFVEKDDMMFVLLRIVRQNRSEFPLSRARTKDGDIVLLDEALITDFERQVADVVMFFDGAP